MSSGLVSGCALRLLFLNLVGLGVQFQCRLFVPFGPGIDIWRSCRFLGAIFRAFRLLLGGLGRFLPGGIGANHCRLRHIGWSKSCHGLTSRLRETSSVGFLDELLVLFGYSAASGADLLAGTLPLRYFSVSFCS